ncbi:MAG: NUDIX hydrolase [bacterium]|nr:NUDIX hydrolase [bacterium]
MDHYTLKLNLTGPVGNLLRKRHVLIVPENAVGNIYIGEKKHSYPEGIYRFIGGGVNEEETPVQAGVREIGEELGLHIDQSRLYPMAEVEINASTPEQKFQLITYMYHLILKDTETLTPADDISGVKEFRVSQIPDLVKRYNNLSGDLYVTNKGDIEYKHSWHDYGKIYGPIHQIAYGWLTQRT